MIEAIGLRKKFGDRVAVDGVSLRLAPGETLGLLGPNGAGKTTTVAMLCGLLEPDEGEVRVDGRPVRGATDPAKKQIGLVPQELALYDELTARANLRFFGALFGLEGAGLDRAILDALELVGLADRADDAVKAYSGGMKRRLNLAAALLHDPAVLILDEPTVGVDPQSRNAIFENLEALRGRGKAILYTTHYMEEAERLCDRIVILDRGRVVAEDTVRGLYGLVPAVNRLQVDLGADSAPDLVGLRGVPGVAAAEFDAGVLTVGVEDLTPATPRVLAWLADRGHRFTHVASERADLEAVFLALTGRSLRDS